MKEISIHFTLLTDDNEQPTCVLIQMEGCDHTIVVDSSSPQFDALVQNFKNTKRTFSIINTTNMLPNLPEGNDPTTTTGAPAVDKQTAMYQQMMKDNPSLAKQTFVTPSGEAIKFSPRMLYAFSDEELAMFKPKIQSDPYGILDCLSDEDKQKMKEALLTATGMCENNKEL